VPGLIAAVTPDNTPGGYNFTYLFPMLLFIVVALILYVMFSRPHRRVPAKPISATAFGRRPTAQMQSAAAGGSAEPAGGPDAVEAGAAATGTAATGTAATGTAATGAGQDAAPHDDTGAGE